MLGATAGNPAGHDLAALRDVIVKKIRSFIVYLDRGIRTEFAIFPTMKKLLAGS